MEHAIMVAAALLGAGITMGLAAIGAGVGDGLVTSKFIDGITRQPEAKSVGLIEAMAIIATVVALIMLYANPLL